MAKLNVLKRFRNHWYESGECDAGAEADLVHVQSCCELLLSLPWGYHLSLPLNIQEVIWRNCWKFDFSHCKNVCAFVCCWACVQANHCLVVASLVNGLSSGSINSAYYIKNQSKRGILRQLLHCHGIPSFQNNSFIVLGVALWHILVIRRFIHVMWFHMI